jgi:hypothetical protein
VSWYVAWFAVVATGLDTFLFRPGQRDLFWLAVAYAAYVWFGTLATMLLPLHTRGTRGNS